MTSQPIPQNKIGVVLLAAGASSRLGQPKQLLVHKGETLLQHSLNVAFASQALPVVLVLGAGAATIKESIDPASAHVVINESWQEGMGASIRCSIDAFKTIYPEAEGVILMVCDQPFVTPSLLQEMIAVHQKTGKPIVASNYAETFGPPVFFHHSFFPQLLQLSGDIGARNIIRQHSEKTVYVSFEQGRTDIDTAKDYEGLVTEVPES